MGKKTRKKLSGLFIVLIATMLAIIEPQDTTVSVLLIPFGLYIMFTKSRVFYFE